MIGLLSERMTVNNIRIVTYYIIIIKALRVSVLHYMIYLGAESSEIFNVRNSIVVPRLIGYT